HCCEAFNIAHDQVHSIRQLLDEISQVTKAEVPTQSAIYKHVELDQVGANIEKAKTLLQWTPKRPLKQMIEDEWRFYQNTLNGR
ncbi:UDP-glucose 4-epimerase, partial [Acinetobacter sp. A11]